MTMAATTIFFSRRLFTLQLFVLHTAIIILLDIILSIEFYYVNNNTNTHHC